MSILKKFRVTEKVIDKAINEILVIINSPNAIILLEGDLASGKTTFVKHFVNYLDISDEVTSPTFSLQHIYGTNIYHYDLYQKGINEFLALGLLESLSESGYHLIEWANYEFAKILKMYGFEFFHLKIYQDEEDNARIYQVSDSWQH